MSPTLPGHDPGLGGGHGEHPKPQLATSLGELGDTGDVPNLTWPCPWASWGTRGTSPTSPGHVPGRAGGHKGCPQCHLAVSLGELGDTGDVPNLSWPHPWLNWGTQGMSPMSPGRVPGRAGGHRGHPRPHDHPMKAAPWPPRAEQKSRGATRGRDDACFAPRGHPDPGGCRLSPRPRSRATRRARALGRWPRVPLGA